MAGRNTKLLDIRDGNETDIKLVERRVSEWQRELRVQVSGKSVGENVREGATYSGRFPVKSPAKQADLINLLTEAGTAAPGSEIRLAFGPHKRQAGRLIIEHAGQAFWTGLEKSWRRDDGARVEIGALLALRDALASYS